ncbi:hypothetical protein GGI23_006650, partial [Coemansia sp. RSA 2559]
FDKNRQIQRNVACRLTKFNGNQGAIGRTILGRRKVNAGIDRIQMVNPEGIVEIITEEAEVRERTAEHFFEMFAPRGCNREWLLNESRDYFPLGHMLNYRQTMAPVTQQEVERALANSPRNKAAGPSG